MQHHDYVSCSFFSLPFWSLTANDKGHCTLYQNAQEISTNLCLESWWLGHILPHSHLPQLRKSKIEV